jgi:hypothetical protein
MLEKTEAKSTRHRLALIALVLMTGNGTSSWLERQSYPVLNKEFCAKLSAVSIRNDDAFNAALVSFGSFGVISAVAIETDPIYHLEFPKVRRIDLSLYNLDKLSH